MCVKPMLKTWGYLHIIYIYQLVFLARISGCHQQVRILIHQQPAFRMSVCVSLNPALAPKNTNLGSLRSMQPFVWVLVGKFHQRVRRRSEGLKPTAGGLKFQHFFWFMLLVTLLKTNMTLENHIFSMGNTSSFMVDFPASHVSFQGCMGNFFVRGSLFNGPGF